MAIPVILHPALAASIGKSVFLSGSCTTDGVLGVRDTPSNVVYGSGSCSAGSFTAHATGLPLGSVNLQITSVADGNSMSSLYTVVADTPADYSAVSFSGVLNDLPSLVVSAFPALLFAFGILFSIYVIPKIVKKFIGK